MSATAGTRQGHTRFSARETAHERPMAHLNHDFAATRAAMVRRQIASRGIANPLVDGDAAGAAGILHLRSVGRIRL
jgi:hypothetical protein